MTIELYYSPFCAVCTDPRQYAGMRRDEFVMKNVTEHIGEAVRLGIVRPPALVIDGRLVAQGAAAIRGLEELMEQA